MSTVSSARLDCVLFLVLIGLALSIAAAAACPCSEFKQPVRTVSIPQGLEFTTTGEYKKQRDDAVAAARQVCEKHLGEPHLAVVSDIDETILDNREVARKYPDQFWPNFNAWVGEARAPLIKPTADFLAWARKHGFAVFLVTGRNETQQSATIENLVRDGVAYDGLFMRAAGDQRSAAVIKPAFRQAIEKMGFKIVVNIGDQPTDLLGCHAEDCELLPNLMYSVP